MVVVENSIKTHVCTEWFSRQVIHMICSKNCFLLSRSCFFRNQLFPRGNRGGVTQYPLNLDFSPDVKTPTYPHIPVFYHTTQKPSNGIGFLKTPWATILCKHGIKAQGQIFCFQNIRDIKFDKIGYLKGYSNIKNALLIIFSLFLPFGEKYGW